MAEECDNPTASVGDELHDEFVSGPEIPQTQKECEPTADSEASGDACFIPPLSQPRAWNYPPQNAEPSTAAAAMSSDDKKMADEGMIFLNDAVQRKLLFPFKLTKTWHGMEALIEQACGHLKAIGPQVKAGYYDLIAPDGSVILPLAWDLCVQPGWFVTMRLWQDVGDERKKEEEVFRKKSLEGARADAADEQKKSAGEDRATIKFKDAVGRKFCFPFHLVRTWQGMEKLIKEAFLHVDVLGPQVLEGHYDLMGPNGEIILPSTWDKMVEPDWFVTMAMWPIASSGTRPGAGGFVGQPSGTMPVPPPGWPFINRQNRTGPGVPRSPPLQPPGASFSPRLSQAHVAPQPHGRGSQNKAAGKGSQINRNPDISARAPVDLSWEIPNKQTKGSVKPHGSEVLQVRTAGPRVSSHSRRRSTTRESSEDCSESSEEISEAEEDNGSKMESNGVGSDNSNMPTRARREASKKGLIVVCRVRNQPGLSLQQLRRPTMRSDKMTALNPLPLEICSAQVYREELAAGGSASLELVQRASGSRASRVKPS